MFVLSKNSIYFKMVTFSWNLADEKKVLSYFYRKNKELCTKTKELLCVTNAGNITCAQLVEYFLLLNYPSRFSHEDSKQITCCHTNKINTN